MKRSKSAIWRQNADFGEKRGDSIAPMPQTTRIRGFYADLGGSGGDSIAVVRGPVADFRVLEVPPEMPPDGHLVNRNEPKVPFGAKMRIWEKSTGIL